MRGRGLDIFFFSFIMSRMSKEESIIKNLTVLLNEVDKIDKSIEKKIIRDKQDAVFLNEMLGEATSSISKIMKMYEK